MDADPATIERLLRERTWLRRLAGALVRDPAAADDLTQQTYVAAIERAPTKVRSPRAWLATVVRNLARDRARAETRRTKRETDRPTRAPIPTPDEVVANAELTERVGRYVLTLDGPYREVLLLRFYEDLPPRRIASHLGIPVETVRTRIKRGLAKVAHRLDTDHEGDRRAWAAPLLLWAAPPAPALAGTAAGGILAMKKTLVLVALALAGIVLIGTQVPGLLEDDAPTETSNAADSNPLAEGPTLRGTVAATESEAATVDAGAASWALVGRVVYPGRVPAAGVQVRVFSGGRSVAADATGRTDADGRFRLYPPRPLEERLHMYRLVAEDDAGRAASREQWNVEVPRERDVDVGRLVLEQGYTLSLRVASEGVPIPGAEIQISDAGYVRQSKVAHLTTDTNGLARTEGLLPLMYRVRAAAEGYATAFTHVSLPQQEGTPLGIHLDPQRSVRVEVVEAPDMRPLAGVEVQVFQRVGWANTSSRERLLCPDAVPPTDARGRTEVTGIGRSTNVEVGILARGWAKPSFNYRTKAPIAHCSRFVAIPPDENEVRIVVPASRRVTWPLIEGDAPVPPEGTVVRLDVARSGMRPFGVETGVIETGRLVVEGLTPGFFTARGRTPAGLVARVVARPKEAEGEPLAFWRPRTLEVVVRESDGTPCPKVSVRLDADGGPQITTPFAHTDADGVARFEDLPAIRGRVRPNAPPHDSHAVDLLEGDQRIEVTVETPEERRAHAVAIRILLDGRPGLPDVYELDSTERDTSIAVEREAEDAATLHARWTPAAGGSETRFALAARGYQPAAFAVTTMTDEVVVNLQRGCALNLQLLHEIGRRPRVKVERYDDIEREWTVARARGSIRLGENRVPLNPPAFGYEDRYTGLPKGRYRAIETKLGLTSDVVVLEAGASATTLVLDCRPAAMVTGCIVLPAGHAANEAIVEVLMHARRTEVPVDAEGSFTFPWPKNAGTVTLTAQHPLLYRHPARGRVELHAAREDLRLELVSGPLARIEIRVGNEGGSRFSPAGKTRIHLRASGDEAALAQVLPARLEGREGDVWLLTFAGFEPGTWALWADLAYRFAPLRLENAALGEADVALGPVTLTRGSSIRIRVETKDGKPPELLTATAEYEGTPKHERMDAVVGESEVVVTGLEAGRYHLVAGPVDPVRDEPPTAIDEIIDVDGQSTYERVINSR